jgi:hypothetical protein
MSYRLCSYIKMFLLISATFWYIKTQFLLQNKKVGFSSLCPLRVHNFRFFFENAKKFLKKLYRLSYLEYRRHIFQFRRLMVDKRICRI